MSANLPGPAGLMLLAAVASASAQEPYNSAVTEAELMPRAAESMLLDVTRTATGFVAVGERGQILKSIDGTAWQQVANVPTRSTLTSVYTLDDNVWAAGHDSVILHSGDGGQSWTRQHVADDVFDPDQNNPLLDIFFIDAQRGFALGAYATFMATDDGGQTWQLREFAAGGGGDDAEGDEYADDLDDAENDGSFDDFEDTIDYHLNGMARLDDGTLYIAAERGNGYVSGDQGATWNEVLLPYGGSMFGVMATSGQTLLTYGMRGHVFESADGGETWTEVATGSLNSLMGAAEDASGSIVLVGANGEVLVRSGGGKFQSRPHDGGGDLAGVAIAESGWIITGEDGATTYQAATEDRP